MSRLTVVMIDNDETYLEPLELKFIEEYGDNAEIIIISEEEYLTTYFAEPKNIDILIINEYLYVEHIQRHKIKNTFILSEDECSTGDFMHNKIYKYTSVKEIYVEIKNNVKGIDIQEEEECKIIMIYSPIGGSGKTTLALGISAVLAQGNKKILYINTETLQTFYSYLQKTEWMPNEFKRFICGRDESVIKNLSNFCANEGFDYLLPIQQSITSLGITLNEYVGMIELLKRQGDYDFILVDSSMEFIVDKSKLMGMSDYVVIVLEQSKTGKYKLESLLQNIDIQDKDKFIFVCNKYKKEEENYLKDILEGKIEIAEYILKYKDIELQNIEQMIQIREIQQLSYHFV